MKKILVSFVAIMAVASSAMAAETMNMHDQVNNAQAPAHQMQSTSEKSAVQGDSMTMMDMSGHDQAAMTHEMMQNGNASAHQDMAEMHKKMMKSKPAASNETAKSFSESKRAARTVLTGMCYSVGSATRQGSSSLTRFIGQSAITSSTWRR
ncbi:copper-binding protein [Klebsiella pneumoniae]|nr:copper-binding protein [Klebsiella pneumoniae]